MEKGNKEPAVVEVFEIELLAEKHKTPKATVAGMMAANGWKLGKRVTEEEYRKAVASFGAAAAGRREDA